LKDKKKLLVGFWIIWKQITSLNLVIELCVEPSSEQFEFENSLISYNFLTLNNLWREIIYVKCSNWLLMCHQLHLLSTAATLIMRRICFWSFSDSTRSRDLTHTQEIVNEIRDKQWILIDEINLCFSSSLQSIKKM
jgi:hypothetical protein